MNNKIDKLHIYFEGEESEYIRKVSQKTGWSADYVAHFLIRNIMAMEQTTEIELKDDVLPNNSVRPGTAPIKFRKKLRMQMKT
ncbi:MAG: hypothetical protein WDA75_13585 [Candidatus Latescibacterota bacterium]|jgi:hypothetical protein